jgi:hypothetical protein
LVYQSEGRYERGAKHYSLTPYGLITSLDKVLSYDHRHILYNKHNIAIRALLSDLFEIDTIDSFDLLKDFPGINLERFLHDCCSITSDICRGFWTGIQRYNLTNILPSVEIIQRYMVHLAGVPIEAHVLEEIKEYEKRLAKRLDNGKSKDNGLKRAVEIYNQAEDVGYHDERKQFVMEFNLRRRQLGLFQRVEVGYNLERDCKEKDVSWWPYSRTSQQKREL